jgi:hypothetical protein
MATHSQSDLQFEIGHVLFIDMAPIKVDPLLDRLRGNPRFEALVQKVVALKK